MAKKKSSKVRDRRKGDISGVRIGDVPPDILVNEVKRELQRLVRAGKAKHYLM